jgi:hypothetical protein
MLRISERGADMMTDWYPILIAAMLLLVLIRLERLGRTISGLRAEFNQLRDLTLKIHAHVVPSGPQHVAVEGTTPIADTVRSAPPD